MDMGGIRLGEDGADGGGDHLSRSLGDLGQDVAKEVDSAGLHRRASHDSVDGLAQTEVGISDDQLHPGEPAGLQAA
jgi:hypothetical protein